MTYQCSVARVFWEYRENSRECEGFFGERSEAENRKPRLAVSRTPGRYKVENENRVRALSSENRHGHLQGVHGEGGAVTSLMTQVVCDLSSGRCPRATPDLVLFRGGAGGGQLRWDGLPDGECCRACVWQTKQNKQKGPIAKV